MLSRIQSQDAALSLSQQKMEALINSIDGIVWERAADSFRFTFVSRQSEQILGFPGILARSGKLLGGKTAPQDAAKTAQTSRELVAQGNPYTSDTAVAADGRIVWIRESGTVIVEKKSRWPCAAFSRM